MFLLLTVSGCKERFEPNLPPVPQGYLVVEGFINAQGPSRFILSRSVSINEPQNFKPELNAIVKIEGDDNSSVAVPGSANGIYTSPSTVLNRANKYRIRIQTSDSKVYLSDLVEPKITPPIDSVSWTQEPDGVRVNINTHDPQNKTIYYRWDYSETWEIRSAYVAAFKTDRIDPVTNFIFIREINTSDPPIFTCWKYDSLKRIITGSSAKLEQDVIYRQPILFIPRVDERLGIRYSIIVRQYALDKNGYLFYEQMKKNTESLGTIFDPQPTALRGNIRCVSNPGEVVVGYINATTAEQRRIFISAHQLTGAGFNIYSICDSKDVPNNQDSLRLHSSLWPYEAIYGPSGGGIIAYRMSAHKCIDCTSRGGRNVMPSFW